VHTDPPIPSADATRLAAVQLHELQTQCVTTRDRLIVLRHDLTLAEQRLATHPAVLLRQANEGLVIAALQAQQRAELREDELGAVTRTLGLDALTQLPNRMLLRDRFTQAAAAARRHGAKMAVLFADLDGFKCINDEHGHAAGDRALCAAARAMESALRISDTVSRHGGDEFVILVSHLDDASDVSAIVHHVAWALSQAHGVQGDAMPLSASLGIAVYPDNGEDLDALIAHADAAMYRSKRDPSGRDDALQTLPPSTAGALPSQPSVLASRSRLRDVNERLVVAVLSARDGQLAAEDAYARQETNLAVTAHELRNPLAPMSYALSLLKSVQAREPLVARVHPMLERQLAHLSRLIGDLVDVSRAATGKLRLAREVLELGPLIDSAVQSCLPEMQRRRQTTDVQLPDEPLRVDGDPVRLQQVLCNLIDNASKYTPDGGSVRVGVTSDPREVVVTVSDNGIGISSAALPHVFEPFVQEAAATEFNGDGLGIGLMLVHQLVHAHGGRVEASSPGRGLGSAFTLVLPRVPPGP
jgi:diguanylate cyclase (GGDEF)-like protein